MPFNPIDLYIFIGSLFFFLIGMYSGFLFSLLSVVAAYVAVFIARYLAPICLQAAVFLSIPTNDASRFTVFIFIFAVAFIIIEYFLIILKKLVNISILGSFDKALGGVVSVFTAFLIAGMIIDLNSGFINGQQKLPVKSVFRDWAVSAYRSTAPLAQAAAGNAKKFAKDKLNIEIKDINPTAVATQEAKKLKSTLDALPRY